MILIINKLNHSLFPLAAACTSREYLNGFSGFFSTTNFPSNFPQYSRCTWNITVPSGYIIKLSFFYFRLEPNQYSPCYYDAPGARVTVTNVASDDGYQPFMLCGQSLPPAVYSVGNSVQVIFTSLSSQYPGFNATYTAITYSSGTCYTLFIRHQQELALGVIQESLGVWIPRCEFWIPGTGFRLSVAVRFRIPFIRGIPDSSSRIVFPTPVFELPYIGGNDSHKQTGKI